MGTVRGPQRSHSLSRAVHRAFFCFVRRAARRVVYSLMLRSSNLHARDAIEVVLCEENSPHFYWVHCTACSNLASFQQRQIVLDKQRHRRTAETLHLQCSIHPMLFLRWCCMAGSRHPFALYAAGMRWAFMGTLNESPTYCRDTPLTTLFATPRFWTTFTHLIQALPLLLCTAKQTTD